MKNKANENYDLIDLLKFFFAFCVMITHTGLSKKISWGFYLQKLVCRLAVPFFFVCSGYFFAIKKHTKEDLVRRLKKLWFPYTMLGIFYTLLPYYMDHLPLSFVFGQIFRLGLLSVGNVVWFLGSLIFSMILMFHIQSNKKLIIFSIIGSFLFYLLGLSFTTYVFLPRNFFFTELSNYLSVTFYNNRNPIFSGYLFFSIGYFIGRFYKDFRIKKWQGMVLVPSLMLLTYLESHYIFSNSSKVVESDFLIMYIPLITVFFLLWKNIRNLSVSTLIFRKMSVIIFYLHMAVIYFYRYLIEKEILVSFNIESKKFDFIVVATTIILSYTISKLQIIHRKEVVK